MKGGRESGRRGEGEKECRDGDREIGGRYIPETANW